MLHLYNNKYALHYPTACLWVPLGLKTMLTNNMQWMLFDIKLNFFITNVYFYR